MSTNDFEAATNCVTAYLEAAGVDDDRTRRRLCARVIRAARAAVDPSRDLAQTALREARRVTTGYVGPSRRLVDTAVPIVVPTKMPPQSFTYWRPFGFADAREVLQELTPAEPQPAAVRARKR